MTLRDFLKIEEELAATEAPELDLSKATSEVMSHYLRAWRGRTELVHAVEALAPSASFAQRLNEIRLALRADELERASALIESTSPSNDLERAELGLERCRYHLFQRNYSEVVRLSEPYLVHPATPAQTKMSLLQIRGIAKTYSDSPHEALPELRAAIAIGSCLSAAPR